MSRLTKTSVQLDMDVVGKLQMRFPELNASEIIRLSLEYVLRKSANIGLRQEKIGLVDLDTEER